MNNRIQHICKIISCQQVSFNTYLLQFVSKEIAKIAKPGQFINVRISENGTGPLFRRPFSISNIHDDIVELLFNKVGKGTEILSRKEKDETIDIIGPLGKYFSINDQFEIGLLIAGGIGIAPFPFLSSELKNKGKKIETFLGFKEAKFIYKSRLENIYIATEDGSEGFKGNVIELLENYLKANPIKNAKIFACGPKLMLKAIANLADQYKINCEVSLEEYMACGLGICQGCPVEMKSNNKKYALVCKDGPIFNVTDIIL